MGECDNLPAVLKKPGMGGTGLERGAELPGKMTGSAEGGAVSGALGASHAPQDSDLLAVIEAWPGLSAAGKAEIMAIVRAAGDPGDGAR
jgi:hypothetical protein